MIEFIFNHPIWTITIVIVIMGIITVCMESLTKGMRDTSVDDDSDNFDFDSVTRWHDDGLNHDHD